jgi:3-hydroxybutyryl-CoA dehydratase
MVLPLQILFFEDLSVGMTETLEKTVSSNDVVGFAELTGDRNPIHLSEHFAAKTSFGRRIAHGLYTASLISAVLGTRLPGPGAVYVSQTLNFRAPRSGNGRGSPASAGSATRWCSTARRW